MLISWWVASTWVLASPLHSHAKAIEFAMKYNQSHQVTSVDPEHKTFSAVLLKP
jgi:hypothetical protein